MSFLAFNYNGTFVGGFDTVTKEAYSILDILKTGDDAQLAKFVNTPGFSLTLDTNNSSPIKVKLKCEYTEGEVRDLDRYDAMIRDGRFTKVLRCDEDNAATVLSMLSAVDVLDGFVAPTERLKDVRSIALRTLAMTINTEYMAVKTISTERMKNPDAPITLFLPTARTIITALVGEEPIPVPSLEELFPVDMKQKTPLFRDNLRDLNLREEDVLGSDDSSYLGIQNNEEILYQSLAQIYDNLEKECEAMSFPFTKDGLYDGTETYFMLLIYIALRHNWCHTGLVPRKADMESQADVEDNGDYSSNDSDSSAERAEYADNNEYILTGSEMTLVKNKLLKSKRIRMGSEVLLALLDDVKRFISLNQSKVSTKDNYIMTFIKLIRWGFRKPNKLFLAVPDQYLDLDTGATKTDLSKSNRKPIAIEGNRYLLPVGYFYNNMRGIVQANEVGMGNVPGGVISGLRCAQRWELVDRGQEVTTKVDVDPLTVIDAYKNNEYDKQIVGLEYDFDKNMFYASDPGIGALLEGRHNEFVSEREAVLLPAQFNPDGYTLPELVLSQVLTANINNKKSTLFGSNLLTLLLGTKPIEPVIYPILMRYGKAISLKSKDIESKDLSFIDLLNGLLSVENEVFEYDEAAEVNIGDLLINKSNAFEKKKLETYDTVLEKVNLTTASRVVDDHTKKTMAYLYIDANKKYCLVHRDSTIVTVSGDVPFSKVLKTYAVDRTAMHKNTTEVLMSIFIDTCNKVGGIDYLSANFIPKDVQEARMVVGPEGEGICYVATIDNHMELISLESEVAVPGKDILGSSIVKVFIKRPEFLNLMLGQLLTMLSHFRG